MSSLRPTLALACASLLLAGPVGADPSFFFPDLVRVPGGPGSARAGDFDEDGALDVAVGDTDSPSGTITILRGDGAGGLRRLRSFAGDSTLAFVADVDGDGHLDLVPYFATSPIQFGDGHAGFTAVPTGADFGRVLKVVDVDRDGHLDLVTSLVPWGVNVLFGGELWDGLPRGFRQGPTVDVGDTDWHLVADVDGDGLQDLVTGYSNGNGFVGTYLGDGKGRFFLKSILSAADNTCGCFVADVSDWDGDSHEDLLLLGFHRIALAHGDGQGAFAPPVVTPVLGGLGGPLIADFDGDGQRDLFTGGSNGFWIRSGVGNGQFSEPRGYLCSGNSPWLGGAGDFDGDGTPDVLVTYPERGVVSVLLVRPDGSLSAPAATETRSGQFADPPFVLGDFDTDGYLDAALANGGVTVLLGDGAGRLDRRVDVEGPIHPTSIAVGDIDENGSLDLVTTEGYYYLAVLLNDGSARFSPQRLTVTGHPMGIALADATGDGHLDILVAQWQIGVIALLPGDGHGHFTLPATLAADGPSSFSVADMNGDGNVDLVSSLEVRLGDGHGQFRLAPPPPPLPYSPPSTVGDVDGDGHLDVVVGSGKVVSLYRGDGAGGLALASTVEFPETAFPQVVELDGSPRSSIWVSLLESSRRTLLESDSTGRLTTAEVIDPGVSLARPVVSDLDGDGVSEVLATAGDLLAVLPRSFAADVGLGGRFASRTDGVAPVDVFTLVATNDGPGPARSCVVRQALVSGAEDAHWTCEPGPGASCGEGGDGELYDEAFLPAGGTVTYTLVAPSSQVSARARIGPSLRAIDPVAANNLGPASVRASLSNASIRRRVGRIRVVRVPVRLSAPAPEDVMIEYTTRDGTALAGVDYLPSAGRLLIPAGTRKASVPISILGDANPRGVAFTVDLTGTSGALFGTPIATVSIKRP